MANLKFDNVERYLTPKCRSLHNFILYLKVYQAIHLGCCFPHQNIKVWSILVIQEIDGKIHDFLQPCILRGYTIKTVIKTKSELKNDIMGQSRTQ
jgi:hypothetical protein